MQYYPSQYWYLVDRKFLLFQYTCVSLKHVHICRCTVVCTLWWVFFNSFLIIIWESKELQNWSQVEKPQFWESGCCCLRWPRYIQLCIKSKQAYNSVLKWGLRWRSITSADNCKGSSSQKEDWEIVIIKMLSTSVSL